MSRSGPDSRHFISTIMRRQADLNFSPFLRRILRLSLQAAVAVGTCTSSVHAQQQISWQRLDSARDGGGAQGSGLEVARFNFNVGVVFSSSIVLVRAQPRLYAPRVIRAAQFGWKRAPVRTLCKSSGARVCINSNFFDEQGRPLGVVMSRGIIHNPIHRGGGTLTGVLYSTQTALRISHRERFLPEGVIEATQAGPRLLANGVPIEGLKSSALSSNLSGACLDSENRLILFRVASGMFGCTFYQLQQLLTRPEIGCRDAINFDGGGSSQLFISAEQTSPSSTDESYPGEDDVPVALGLFPIAAPEDMTPRPTSTPTSTAPAR